MLLIYAGVRAVSVLVEWQQWESLRFGEYGNVAQTPDGGVEGSSWRGSAPCPVQPSRPLGWRFGSSWLCPLWWRGWFWSLSSILLCEAGPLHCQVPSLAGRSHRVHPRDREGAGPSSSRGHQQPYLQGGKATFLCHASHRACTTCPPCWRDRGGSKFGSCSSFCCMSVLVLSLGCSTTGAHKIRTRVSLPHPRAKSPRHRLTVGRPPTWHPTCTVTRDTRGILTHRDQA